MVDEDAVESYIDRSQSLIEASPQMGEENTKVKIIQPLIDLLGWDVFSEEVKLEYSMQIGSGSTHADYALQLEGTPVVFIEAKGCDSTLSDSDRSQLSSYMRQKGVDWGLLTNGDHLEVIKRRTDSPHPEEVTLADFPIEELSQNWSVVQLLSKDLVQTEEADKIARRIRSRKSAVRILSEKKDSLGDELAQVVIDEVGEELSQEIEEESKEFVDQLVDSLGSDTETDVHLTGGKIDISGGSVEAQGYAVTLYKDGEALSTVTKKNQIDVMAQAIDVLVRDHDLIGQLGSLPYVPGEKRAILNTKPEHPTGDEMILCREISGGYYVFASLNKESKQRYIRKFAKKCGLEAGFSGDW